MKKILKKALLIAGVLYSISLSAQESGKVSGTVYDETNSPLPGASVIVKGTSTGVVTGPDGKYSINASSNQTLEFSFVGYDNRLETVGSRTVIDVVLEASAQKLSELVVVGYGESKKEDLTGAVKKVDSKGFNKGVVTSADQLLQGRVSGVQITQTGGEPGAQNNFNIRGVTSIRAGNGPLIVVDGFPLTNENSGATANTSGDAAGGNVGYGETAPKNPLNFINPANIESLTVLKDASATAIYGSRGANGVVIITTKSGTSGAGVELNYSGQFGFSNPSKKLPVLSASEYRSEFAKITAADPTKIITDGKANTDWQDVVTRTAINHTHNISFGETRAKSSYNVALGYLSQEGILKNSKLETYTINLKGGKTMIKDRLRVNFNLLYGNNQDQSPGNSNNVGFDGNIISMALIMNPTLSPLDVAGKPAVYAGFRNPQLFLDYLSDKSSTNRILGNTDFSLEIIKGLKINGRYGYDYSNSKRTVVVSPKFDALNNGLGSVSFIDKQLTTFLAEQYISYDGTFGKSKISAIAGMSYQSYGTHQVNTFTQNFSNLKDYGINLANTLGGADYSSKTIRAYTNSSSDYTYELQSFYGRVNYNFAERYIITATVRADGSSKFGSDNKYGVFPSFSAAWRIMEESFMSKDGFLSDLKLRAGWGITGNQEFPGQISKNVFTISNGAISQQSNSNSKIKWEETNQLNVGIDFGFFKNRISGNIDFYNKETKDLIFQASAVNAPVGLTWSNLDGTILNNGLDIDLNGAAIETRDISLDIGFNMNVRFNNGLVSGISDALSGNILAGQAFGQGLTDAYTQTIKNGQPINVFYLYKYSNYDKNSDSYLTSKNKMFLGSPYPDLVYGLNLNFRYKWFDLALNMNGVSGAKVFNNTSIALFQRNLFAKNNNVIKDALNNGSINNPVPLSDFYLEDASFFRFNNLTVGYNYSGKVLPFIKTLRAYVTLQNLAVLTAYKGFDPEVSNINSNAQGVPSVNMDYLTYPKPFTFTFGLNLGL